MRGGYPRNHQSVTEGGVLYCSSPSDTSLIQPWTPPPTQRVIIDDFQTSAKRGAISGPLCFTPTMEGTSIVRDDPGSTSSRSDCSDFEHSKRHLSTPRNFPSRRSFMSKPIYPSAGLSGGSSIDLADISDLLLESNHLLSRPSNFSEGYKCGICDKLLSQRSPWSLRSGDLPITGVLVCRHVFHTDCLEKMTPKSHRNDPPCPICTKVGEENSTEKCVIPKMRNSFPRLRGCVQVGDCVEGALRAPNRSTSKIMKSFSLKGKTDKDFPEKLKKSGSYRRFVDQVAADGCSTTSVGSSSKTC
ncbi:hypothetical protein RND81_02G219000 [Saponaria officinalis]|uniref:RING-type domain-containing protein n=1 Tax=Saponaria officinalis TaxID=3572 RepID=A0AAW1MT20_SAPOF